MNEKPRLALHRAGVRCLHALAYLVVLSLPATAAGRWDNLLGCGVPDCIGKWCPDDYCAKKEPCVRVPLSFGCDNYCGKKVPCVGAPLYFGCDDYCKKCPPKACSGPLSQFLRCGSSCQPCGCAKCNASPRDAYVDKQIKIKDQLSAVEDQQWVSEQSPKKPQPLPPVFVGASDFKLTK